MDVCTVIAPLVRCVDVLWDQSVFCLSYSDTVWHFEVWNFFITTQIRDIFDADNLFQSLGRVCLHKDASEKLGSVWKEK